MTEVVRDVVFSSPPGYRPLSLDLHLPDARAGGAEAEALAPVIVFLHGGGWRVGSRRMFVPKFSDAETFGRLTSAGFAVASVDYRLTGEALFPAQLDDVRAALDWLRASGGEHGIDASRMVVWGESAGGHLASLAGIDRQLGVRGVVAWYPPTDLIAFRKPGPGDERPTREEQLIGGVIDDMPDAAALASPARLVHPDAPPFHVAHGDADEAVDLSQSELLVAALRREGAHAELQVVPGAGHMWQGLASLDAVMEPAIAFARNVTG
ncbi:alpha/beta hydrolase [Microbacterium halophytorum]|uniref:alpha/beta hydrolase n=1 Tax=Microbacterium halophytorum TaxID=2067568 RepID=UPI000CFC1119|nr:alpha/beta hydrolase [Microbacterium halophytorum]